MEYKRLGDLKVSCIASSDDLDFFGVVLDDLLDRTQQGYQFIKKVKELEAKLSGISIKKSVDYDDFDDIADDYRDKLCDEEEYNTLRKGIIEKYETSYTSVNIYLRDFEIN